jgi:large conductance mechanosensitive channel
MVVVPVNTMMAKFHPAPAAAPKNKLCPECLSDIPVAAKRCSHCAQLVA